MRRKKLVDRRCPISILVGRMVTMQISAQRRIKEKHPQLTWSRLKCNKLLLGVRPNNQNGIYKKKFGKQQRNGIYKKKFG